MNLSTFAAWFNRTRTWVVAIAIVLVGLVLLPATQSTKVLKAELSTHEKIRLGAFPITIPTIKYGFAIDTFQYVQEGIVQNGQFLGDLLQNAGMDYADIDKLVNNNKEVFDFRTFRVGKNYTILSRDTTQSADYFIYEPSVYNYYVFDLKEKLQIEKIEHPIEMRREVTTGVVESSLWNAMVDAGASFTLTAKLEDALQWSIDFHHVQKGDQFKAVYEREYINGEPVGVGKVHAGWYKNANNEYHAIWYENETMDGYFDLEGRPMDKGFLKAPVKYGRISSGFNLRRFHPVLKRTRPHYGTDYAAPRGTPIYAVADGVITKASRTRGNGNFVKIRHDKVYETQYLHMQKFAEGITPGVHVKQNQVIGYVGSTGLATGPHVCFRFWKNGKQVNHRKLNFPPPAPLPEADLPKFKEVRDGYLVKLDAVEAKELPKVTETAVNEEVIEEEHDHQHGK